MVLIVLALIWAAVLIPPLIRQRAEVRPADSIVDFHKRLGVLERTTPTAVEPAYRLAGAGPDFSSSAAVRRRESQRRRRDVLFGLLAGMGSTLLLAVGTGFSSMIILHVLLDLAFVAYVGLLIYMRQLAEERRTKLRYLPVEAVEAVAAPVAYEGHEDTGVVLQHATN